MDDLDLLLRAATVALAFSAASTIALRRHTNAAAPYAAFTVAGIGAFMIASAPGAHRTLGLAAFFNRAFKARFGLTPSRFRNQEGLVQESASRSASS